MQPREEEIEAIEAATTRVKAPPTPDKRNSRAGCGSFLFFKLLTAGLLVGFGLNRAGKAGVGLDVMVRQPALATAAIGVMAHGDFEFVSLDKYRGTLTLRQKDTGQTSTLRPERVLRGDVLESGRKVGKLLEPGESASGMPAWAPVYPGAKSQGVARQDSADAQRGVASYEVYAAPVAQVADFYERALRKSGLAVSQLAEDSAITVSGRDGAREVKVVVGSRGAFSSMRITFAERD